MTNYDKNKWTTQPQKPKPQEKPTTETINLDAFTWSNNVLDKIANAVKGTKPNGN
jgi:hypothetical protein